MAKVIKKVVSEQLYFAVEVFYCDEGGIRGSKNVYVKWVPAVMWDAMYQWGRATYIAKEASEQIDAEEVSFISVKIMNQKTDRFHNALTKVTLSAADMLEQYVGTLAELKGDSVPVVEAESDEVLPGMELQFRTLGYYIPDHIDHMDNTSIDFCGAEKWDAMSSDQRYEFLHQGLVDNSDADFSRYHFVCEDSEQGSDFEFVEVVQYSTAELLSHKLIAPCWEFDEGYLTYEEWAAVNIEDEVKHEPQ